MTNKLPAIALLAGLYAAATSALGADLEQSCKRLLDQSAGVWTMASVSEQVRAFAARRRINPLKVRGDFDGDGRKDIALLIQAKAKPVFEEPDRISATRVAVCLAKKRSIVLRLIDAPYCDDFVYLVRRGEKIYDIESGNLEQYPVDAIGTSCFGKAGAVFVLEGEHFRKIVNSD